MRLLRQLFLSISLRERALIVAFLGTILALWLLVILRALRADISELRTAGVQLEFQELQIARADEVKARLTEALANLDSTRTYGANQLVGKIDGIAREIGLRYDLSTASTRDSDIFATHAVRLRVDNGNLSDLARFNQILQEESPYIVLNQFQISSNQRDPRLLDASFEISSIQLKENVAQ